MFSCCFVGCHGIAAKAIIGRADDGHDFLGEAERSAVRQGIGMLDERQQVENMLAAGGLAGGVHIIHASSAH